MAKDCEPEKPRCCNGQHLVPFIIGKPTGFGFSQVMCPQIYNAVQECSLEAVQGFSVELARIDKLAFWG